MKTKEATVDLIRVWEPQDTRNEERKRDGVIIPKLSRRYAAKEEERRCGVPFLIGRWWKARLAMLGFSPQGSWVGALLQGQFRLAALNLVAALSASTFWGAIAFGLLLAAVSLGGVVAWRWFTMPEFAESGRLPWFYGSETPAQASPLANEGLLGKIPGIYKNTGKELDDTLLVIGPRGPGFDPAVGVSTQGVAAVAATERSTGTADMAGDLVARLTGLHLSTGATVGAGGVAGSRAFRLAALGRESRMGNLGAGANGGAGARAEALRDGVNSALRADVGRAPVRSASSRAATGGLRRSGIAANLTMGQLKYAGTLSAAATGPGLERASGVAAAQFEQHAVDGGELVGPSGGGPTAFPGGPDVSINNPGGQSGVQPPDLPEDPGGPITPIAPIPTIGVPKNVTPYQSDVDLAKQESDQARSDDNMGTMLLMIAAAIMLAAAALMKSWITAAIGAALMVVGIVMMMTGQGKKKSAKDHANNATSLGDKVGSSDEQKKQADIIKADAAAAAKGKKATPPPFQPPPTNVHDAAERQATATFVAM